MRLFIINRKYIKYILVFIIFTTAIISFIKFDSNHLAAVFKINDRLIPIYSVDTEEKKIAISFDAAWGSDYTEELLSILKSYDVKTSFFLVAFWIDKYPEMVKRIDEEGHEIGNHSAKHPKMSQLSKEDIIKELSVTSKKIADITGKNVNLFRPPFGDYNNRLMQVAKELGYHVIQWDVDSLDYRDYGVDAIVERVLKRVENGSIVLFHNNATYTAKALPIIIEGIQERGFEIVPISDLIYKDNYYTDHTGRQKSITNR